MDRKRGKERDRRDGETEREKKGEIQRKKEKEKEREYSYFPVFVVYSKHLEELDTLIVIAGMYPRIIIFMENRWYGLGGASSASHA